MGVIKDLKIRLKEAAYRRAKSSKGEDKRVAPGAPKLAPVFGQTLDECHDDLSAIAGGEVLVCGDGGFTNSVRETLAELNKTNRVVGLGDSIQSVGPHVPVLAEQDFSDVAAVIVGGPRLKAIWPQLLRMLYQNGLSNPSFPVLWIGDGFEWCFGSLAFPKDAQDVDIFLFHHWSAYVGMKDHVLARLRVFDEEKERVWHQILAPNETIRIRMSEMLPNWIGTTGIRVETYHPRLIGRRNHRWRPWADVYTDKSITSLHAAHEPPKPKRVSQFIVDVSRDNTDELVVTLPNYYHDLPENTEDVSYKLCDASGVTKSEAFQDRKVGQTVSSLKVSMKDVPREVSQCRIQYRGAGGSFWYNRKDIDGIDCIAANHTVSSPYDVVEATRISEQLETELFADKDVIIWPYPVPVTPADHPVEFGFNFLCSQPEFHHYRGLMIDAAGQKLGEVVFEHTGKSHCMASSVLADATPDQKARTSMLMVVPDWTAERRRPDQVRVDGLMIAKCRATGDFDNTEFQNAWRNVGALIPGYRHWLFDNMMLTGRTNLKGRLNRHPELRNGILLINSSGRLSYKTSARVTVQVIGSNGTTIGQPVNVAPHGYSLVWLDELFPNMEGFLGDCEATVLAQSQDADCNGHMVTLRDGKAVSLQHMWGY